VQLAQEVVTGGVTVVDAIERLFAEHLEESIATARGIQLTTVPRAAVHPVYYIDRFANLSHLQQSGYTSWYPEVRFATPKCGPFVDEFATSGFVHGYKKHGGGVEATIRHHRRELKTQINYTVRLTRIAIPGSVFRDTITLLRLTEIKQPLIANLTLGCERFIDDRIEGFRVVSFDHIVTGERRFCSCHAGVHTAMTLDAKRRAPSYTSTAWPHRVIELLKHSIYVEDLCHFCINTKQGEAAATDRYGTQILNNYMPYVDLLVRRDNMDVKTARAETKRRLSISRWTREDKLYAAIAQLFPNHTIRREASPRWLGRQRLDIYLPALRLALEHQGEQHYRPIDIFGGVKGYAKTQERDALKRQLCKANGVTVVDIRFDAPLTLPSLRSRLRRWITPQ